MRLLLASNDQRARFLCDELAKLVDVAGTVNFDHHDPLHTFATLTDYTAAALSARYPRMAWYRAYQMHPLLQQRRARDLEHKVQLYHGTLDALLMWGSWFRPSGKLPYFQYFDESLAPPHGLPWSPWRKASFRMQAETYRDAAGLFCMSQWAKDQIVAWHRNCADKTHVVGWGPCGIDLSAKEIPESERKPWVLHVSSDPDRKGVDYLIDTAKPVRVNLPEAQFFVIGDLGDRASTAKFLQRGVGHVQFIGRITDKEHLAHWFRQASIFFLPHRYDRSPHVAVEAMSAGLPIITSRQGGMVSLIDGHGIGALVEPGDIGGYQLAIEALLRNPERRASMGARARDLMRREYNWPRVAEKIVGVISATTEKK